MIATSVIFSLATVLASLVLERLSRLPAVSRLKAVKRQLLQGAALGMLPLAGSFFFTYDSGADIVVFLGDAPTIVAGFFFGPFAAVVSGLLAVAAHALPRALGLGSSLWLVSAAASLVVSLFAAALAKWAFFSRRPALLPALLGAGIAELSYFSALFLLRIDHFTSALDIAAVAVEPMVVTCALTAAAAAVALRSWGTWRANFIAPVSLVLILYSACYLLFAYSEDALAARKTKIALDYHAVDVGDSIDDQIAVALRFIGNPIVREIGTAHAMSNAEMVEILRRFMVDEINVIDTTGENIGSSDPGIARRGGNMNDSPRSSEFMVLVNGKDRFFHQPFRHGVHNPDVVRKYFGVSFPDGSGFVQIGYDIRRFNIDFRSVFSRMFNGWQLGECGYLVAYNTVTGKIACEPCGHKEAMGKDIHEIGISQDFVFPGSSDKTFSLRLFGEKCLCRIVSLGDWRYLVVIPLREFYGPANLTTFFFGTILFCVFSFFWILFAKMSSARRKIDELREAEDKRRAGDLALARTIQMSALPMVFPPFPRDFTLDLFAQMEPAREVGGDFYDFFYLAQDRLAVLVADVSGKGVPAAMFMMKAKATIKSCLFSFRDISKAIEEANTRLAEANDAEMFVSCWVGVLNRESGEIEYVNAGHNPPYIRRLSGEIESLGAVSGLVLAAIGGLSYVRHVIRLNPGDSLFLYTDGVTEAIDMRTEMFEEARLEKALSSAPVGEGQGMWVAPRELCRTVRDALGAFVGETPQFDDITMLALLWRGQPESSSLKVPVDGGCQQAVVCFVEERLGQAGCNSEIFSELMVAVDEITANIISYSGSPDIEVVFELGRNPSVVRLTFVDSGKPYNPLEHNDPDVTASAEEREIGGLGILIVKRLMDEVFYEWRDGRNILQLRKAL